MQLGPGLALLVALAGCSLSLGGGEDGDAALGGEDRDAALGGEDGDAALGSEDGGGDPCADVTCSGHGTCVNQGGGALCDCDPGYRDEGLSCVSSGHPRDALLAWLVSLPDRSDKKLISGQVMNWDQPFEGAFAQIAQQSGEWPGLYGIDYYNPAPISARWSEVNPAAIAYWNAGGLITLSLHMPNPQTSGSSWDTDIDWESFSTPGSALNDSWMAEMAKVGDGLQDLEENGVVVLFRPFHEMDGAWFWWGARASFSTVWIQLHDYLTNQRGLDNLLWVYASSNLDHYPGDAYVDIVGIDAYTDDISSYTSIYQNLLTTGKPVALTEYGCGGVSDCSPGFDATSLVNGIRQHLPRVIFWQSWCYVWGMENMSNTQQALTDPWVINRDDVSF